MQVLKYGLFLAIGIAAQACGGGDSESGGDDDSDSGGSSSNGGSTGNGGSGKGGSSSGTTGNGGSSSGTTGNGGSSSGTTGNGGSSSGTTGNGGSAGTGNGGTAGTGGGCTGGQVNLYDTPECREFFECIFDSACADAGAQQQVCVDLLKMVFSSTVAACAPAADAAAACDLAKADPSVGMTYPACVD